MHGHSRGLHQPRLYDFLILLMTKGRERLYREQLLDLAAVGAGQRVLDIGCGTGTTAIAAAKRVGAKGAVSGIDVSEKMITAARRKASGAVDFHVSDALTLPFQDATFDTAFLTTVLHMVPQSERAAVLREASRVLRSGGHLLLVDYGGHERHGLIAKHHLHQSFDLEAIRPLLAQAQLIETGAGALDWLSLRYLLVRKS